MDMARYFRPFASLPKRKPRMPTEYPIPDFDRLSLSGPKLTLRRIPQPIDLSTRLLFAAYEIGLLYRIVRHITLGDAGSSRTKKNRSSLICAGRSELGAQVSKQT